MPKKVEVGSGIVIGIPTLGRPVPMDWAFSFKSMTPPINYNMQIVKVLGKPVAEARNNIVKASKELKSKYTFFLGDDVVVPAHTLRQLIFRMEHDEDLGVVGGIYCSKSTPPAPLVFKGNGKGSFWKWSLGEYFEVTGIGMDCTLIRNSMLRDLKEPYFKTVDGDQFLDGINNAEQWTEDLYFCKKVLEESNYKIKADAMVMCDHYDEQGVKYSIPMDSYPIQHPTEQNKQLKKENKKILDIGCGKAKQSFKEGKPVTVDIREDCDADYICDIRQLPFRTGEFDIVFSSHVLEHFGRWEWEDVLKEWVRVLSPKGELRLILPDVEWAMQEYLKGNTSDDVYNVFYGAQDYPYDYHKNGLTKKLVENALKELGLKVTKFKQQKYNMFFTAVFKKAEAKNAKSVKENIPMSAHGRAVKSTKKVQLHKKGKGNGGRRSTSVLRRKGVRGK